MKTFIKSTMVLVCATCLGYSGFVSQNQKSIDLSFSNVEALASAEGTTECRWGTRETAAGWEAICIKTGVGYVCDCGDVKPYY